MIEDKQINKQIAVLISENDYKIFKAYVQLQGRDGNEVVGELMQAYMSEFKRKYGKTQENEINGE